MKVYDITPVSKPRMTQRDKRLPVRPCVAKYWAFKDEIFYAKLDLLESGTSIMFILPMPKSWPKQKKQKMAMTAHQQTPDLDNLIKAIFDACYKDDCVIYDIRATKLWGDIGQIWIKNEGKNENK